MLEESIKFITTHWPVPLVSSIIISVGFAWIYMNAKSYTRQELLRDKVTYIVSGIFITIGIVISFSFSGSKHEFQLVIQDRITKDPIDVVLKWKPVGQEGTYLDKTTDNGQVGRYTFNLSTDIKEIILFIEPNSNQYQVKKDLVIRHDIKDPIFLERDNELLNNQFRRYINDFCMQDFFTQNTPQAQKQLLDHLRDGFTDDARVEFEDESRDPQEVFGNVGDTLAQTLAIDDERNWKIEFDYRETDNKVKKIILIRG